MGEVDSDINSQSALSNPAILAWIDERELSLQHIAYFSDIRFSQMAYVHPLGWDSAFSATLGYLGAGNMVRTIADEAQAMGYSETGNFDASDMLFSAGYGQRLSTEFSWGAGIRVARESIDGHAETGVMASIAGFYYPLGGLYHPLDEKWQIGFGLLNIGPRAGDYDMPTSAFVSIGKHLNPRLFAGGEVIGYVDQMGEIRIGCEYDITDALFLRAGYKHRIKEQELGDFPSVDVSGGLGFRFKQFSVDYAWAPSGDLGTTHRITVGVLLGKEGKPAMKMNAHRRIRGYLE